MKLSTARFDVVSPVTFTPALVEDDEVLDVLAQPAEIVAARTR
jgi:hypothetical protein